jgi:hypothetical protein
MEIRVEVHGSLPPELVIERVRVGKDLGLEKP